MSNVFLFTSCVLIWGSTWLAITFQVGEVSSAVSVVYRFALASLMLGAFCWWRKLPLAMPTHLHIKMAAVGLSLYTLDYSLLYESQKYIVSAVLALMSSCIIYINVVLRRLILKKPMRLEVVLGATLGLVGMVLIFLPEFAKVGLNELLVTGIILAMMSFFFASVGNIISERILDTGAPVIQMNFWAMSYGVVWLSGYVFISGADWVLPTNPEYYLSLGYLALFGSVLAFGAYMKLVQQIGSDKSAYVVLMYPIVALVLSTLFEGYQWHLQAFIGVAIVLFGNAVAMGKVPIPRRPVPL